jgi:hypothetical protein
VYIPSTKGAQLQVTGIMTKEEVENVEGLLDPQYNNLLTSGSAKTNTAMLKTTQIKTAAAVSQLYSDWTATVDRQDLRLHLGKEYM